MEQTKYQCICGRTFEKANAFNGHKSHCLIHQQAKNNLDNFKIDEESRHSKAKNTLQIKAAQAAELNRAVAENNLSIWISEQHTCEKCGKIMTEKYGSGRFCCRACANSREHSEETKEKISLANKGKIYISTQDINNNLKLKQVSYSEHPKLCADCGIELPFELHKRKRCPACSNIHRSAALSKSTKLAVQKAGGNLNQYGVRGRCHYGTYKGFHCDSSYELAFVVYCLEHNIDIVRNKTGFKYEYNNQEHFYYPDFIVNNEYIEIKNYWTEQVQAKIDYFPKELSYKILYKADMKPYIKYCVDKYGASYWDILYE